ncbi:MULTISPECIES: hypothetical protein [unclassified Duganella]|uniref:hypothetical protein n=1 Tax=unclassified Duganella TaxID=2636909 RepID=UPI00088EC638|nr:MULTISPECIES: hypothetical protein [unclassified Duganella]SDG83474.1 hypothetical protein SAMN05216320_107234 [Duganella sp. OV458]SDK10896.1 hypothetical protein SAMN05428973_108235 [Duganella sp. OV510]
MSTAINAYGKHDAEYYVDWFENRFEEYVGDFARVIVLNGQATVGRPMIQALVNAYHDLGYGITPLRLSPAHINTLHMLVLITGASLEHSGENEGLNILEAGRFVADR